MDRLALSPAEQNSVLTSQLDETSRRRATLVQQPGLYPSTNVSQHDPEGLSGSNADSAVVKASRQETAASYLGDSGYMSMFSPTYTKPSSGEALRVDQSYTVSPLSATLRSCYLEVFHEYCSTLCPILDQNMLDNPYSGRSLLLEQALALVSTTIQPPLLGAHDSAIHYVKAKELFNALTESNPLASLIAVMLFYWWSTCSPNVVSKNGTWFWTGIAIRQAQELGLHKRHQAAQCHFPGDSPGLRSRIWWTLFARERLTSVSQGRPCTINLKDCNIDKPSLADFPASQAPRAEIFVQWVDLCEVVGDVGKHLRRHPESKERACELLDQLRRWSHNLPARLRLPYFEESLTGFDRDICQLHMPYLSALILLDMKKTSQPELKAHTVALLAASCIARVFEDFLVRGSLRFLQGMSGWYATVALLALIRANHIRTLQTATEGSIQILRVALKDMAQRWPSSKMFDSGIEHLLSSVDTGSNHRRGGNTVDMPEDEDSHQMARLLGIRRPAGSHAEIELLKATDIQAAMKYFPGATNETTSMFTTMLSLTDPIDFFNCQDAFDSTVFDLFDSLDYPLDGFGDFPMSTI